ncbi:MAG: hypothetical protein NUV64_01845 [Parcubacteria group bacterium]|nr:hypothetical protein [Parcubacteria group bacterium]MCR4342910.1 hypothetical protein [Patescibacteria group bacterium]
MEECICAYHCCHKEEYSTLEMKEDTNELGNKYYFQRKKCRRCGAWLGDKPVR